MDILIFILVLSFLVIIHELGHFLCAKKAGVKVEEFGLGYPPTAVTLFTDKQGTAYTLNWLPFGGFVRLFGEDGEASGDGAGAFVRKPVGARLLIVVAGAAVNFAFGVLAFGAIYTKMGIPEPLGFVQVSAVMPDSPAAGGGLRPDDQVWAAVIDGAERPVYTVSDFKAIVLTQAGTDVPLRVLRQGENITLILHSRSDAELPAEYQGKKEEEKPRVGASLTEIKMVFYPWWQMPFRGVWVGLSAAVRFGLTILDALGDMVSKLVLHGVVPQEVAGPIGIGHEVGKQKIFEGGWLPTLNFAAILSINLAIMNVLPLPALDGGRVVFLVFEAIFRKRVKPALEQKVNMVGFIALIALIVLISIKDIGRVVTDPNVQGFFQNLWPF